MSSPVLEKMICGSFSDSVAPRLELEGVDARVYSDVLDMWCGKDVVAKKELGDVMAWRAWRIGLR